jgi:Leucine-rich repeat (LRR) protein
MPNILDTDKAHLLNYPNSLLHKYYIKAGSSVFKLIEGDTLYFKDVSPIHLKELPSISNPERIKKLTIDNTILIKNIIFNVFKNLEELYLKNNQLSNIDGIDKLYNLKKVVIQDNQITDITSLIPLENLTYLNLKNNNISSFNGLESLKNLTYLDLSYNKISDLGNLSALKKLIFLDLSHNLINEIDCRNFPKIKKSAIDLTQNPIIQIRNQNNKVCIFCLVTHLISLLLIENKLIIEINDKAIVLIKENNVFINQDGFWYKSEKVRKNLPGFASVETFSFDTIVTRIKVSELYFSKFSDYSFQEPDSQSEFKELYHTLQSWANSNYKIQILQKRIELPLLKELGDLANIKNANEYIDERDYVHVPVERYVNNRAVREFKTYKIIKKLE